MLDEKKLQEEMSAHTTHETLNGELTGLAWIQLSEEEWLRVLSSCRVPKGGEMLVDGETLKRLMSTRMRQLVKPLDGTTGGFKWDLELFDKLVDASKLDIQPPDRIEAAIRTLKKQNPSNTHADLLRWVLTGEKDQDTWEDKDFGLVPNEGEVL